ncbi:MAG: type II CAAX endopeptidase family protein [Verrucomicrobiales bacterium]|nr:type II CAAX endopeptidase family protein [Verrucomicrobiales bacterium]
MLSEKPWRAEVVMLFCAAQFACLCLGLTIGMLLHRAGVAGFKQPEDFGNILFSTLSFQGAAWLLILFFLRLHQTGWAAAFGWRGPKLKAALFTAVKFIMVILPVVLLLQLACVSALEKFGWLPEKQVAVLLLLKSQSVWLTVYFGVFAVVIAPVAEEFIFRGMLFPFVEQLGFPKLAWFGVSALFALIHMNAPTFVPLFVFALTLTWLYEKTDNLLAPITAHALFNATNLVLLLWQSRPPTHE